MNPHTRHQKKYKMCQIFVLRLGHASVTVDSDASWCEFTRKFWSGRKICMFEKVLLSAYGKFPMIPVFKEKSPWCFVWEFPIVFFGTSCETGTSSGTFGIFRKFFIICLHFLDCHEIREEPVNPEVLTTTKPKRNRQKVYCTPNYRSRNIKF